MMVDGRGGVSGGDGALGVELAKSNRLVYNRLGGCCFIAFTSQLPSQASAQLVGQGDILQTTSQVNTSSIR